MHTDDADLVPFPDVRVIRSTAPALLCRIGGKAVWLPRWHISGKLWCTGDRGRLFIRRWVARDRHLIDARGAAIQSSVPSLARLPAALHLVRRDRNAAHAE
jgi:hypothetical protein